LVSGARILVMDEPLAHVDPGRVGSYWTAVREHCATTGAALIFATHSPEVVLREATHVLCLANGRLSYAGSVTELYDHPSSPELALMLGPCNWLPTDEANGWFDGSIDTPKITSTHITPPTEQKAVCIRPERLQIEPTPSGSSKVEAARFAGASAEVDLVDERDGRRRTFVHRPAGSRLRPGDRVLLKVVLLLVSLLVIGCDNGAEPILNVKHEAYWMMPPDGPRVPAPRGMTVSPDGEYLVLDNAGRLLVFDANGKLQRQWWMPETSVGKPEGVCVLKDGRIAVADTHYFRVVLFSHEGDVVGMFGTRGTGPGQFEFPVSVIQDDKENLYVCEYGNFNDRVQKFRPDGTFIRQIGSYGTDDGQFQRPSGAAWFDGLIYVVDAFNNRIQVFNEDGKLVEILGKSDKISDLYYPYDISVTERGELFVVEYGAGRVSKFDRSGRLLGRYGHTGPGSAQFSTPWGMAVDHRGRIYVCDTGNRRIVELEL
jgi:DNA-binding beta-propeller fold protein YncE